MKYNIFGDPISADDIAATEEQSGLPRQPLAQEIEVERTARTESPAASTETLADLDKLYEAAEKLLRSGKNLENVSNETNLPLDEVRALSQMMVREAQTKPEEKPATNKMPTGNMEVFKPARLSVNTEAVSEPAEPTKDGASSRDPRLGALAGMRREIQVL